MKQNMTEAQQKAVYVALILIVIFTVVCFFLLIVYIDEAKNTKEIVYVQPTVTEMEQQTTAGSNNTRSNTSRNNAATDKIESLLDIIATTSTVDKLYSTFELPESQTVSKISPPVASTTSTTSEATSSSLESDVSEGEHSLPEEPIPPVNNDFSAVYLLCSLMEEHFGVPFSIATTETPNALGNSFEDADEAFTLLASLYIGFNKIPTDTWNLMLQQNVAISIVVVASTETQTTPYSLYTDENSLIVLLQQSDTNWNFELCYAFIELCDYLLANRDCLEDAYTNFTLCNPIDFTYQQYAPQYIATTPDQTYFLDIFSQGSMLQDRQALYAYFYNDGIADEYLSPLCPIYYKLLAIEDGYTNGFAQTTNQ